VHEGIVLAWCGGAVTTMRSSCDGDQVRLLEGAPRGRTAVGADRVEDAGLLAGDMMAIVDQHLRRDHGYPEA
jgi:hypothetical protein